MNILKYYLWKSNQGRGLGSGRKEMKESNLISFERYLASIVRPILTHFECAGYFCLVHLEVRVLKSYLGGTQTDYLRVKWFLLIHQKRCIQN